MIHSFETARKNMVAGQLMPNQVTDAGLLAAVRVIPREQFVPTPLQGLAYADEDIDLGNGRFLPEPRVLLRLLQEAAPGRGDIALDIGCGTGYSSAVLGCVAGTVVGIENDTYMAQEADKLLHNLDICNAVVVQQEDLTRGYPQQGPYNVILINGSVPAVPANILSQLAEGGRLAAVKSQKGQMGSAILVTRTGDSFTERKLFDAAMPALKGFGMPKAFEF